MYMFEKSFFKRITRFVQCIVAFTHTNTKNTAITE